MAIVARCRSYCRGMRLNTSTQHSNIALQEIFSDNYTTDGPQLLSQQQAKTTSQQLLRKKVKNEKETKH